MVYSNSWAKSKDYLGHFQLAWSKTVLRSVLVNLSRNCLIYCYSYNQWGSSCQLVGLHSTLTTREGGHSLQRPRGVLISGDSFWVLSGKADNMLNDWNTWLFPSRNRCSLHSGEGFCSSGNMNLQFLHPHISKQNERSVQTDSRKVPHQTCPGH